MSEYGVRDGAVGFSNGAFLMKFTKRGASGNEETVIMLWGDHRDACVECRKVVADSPGTFSLTCFLGAKLLTEHLQTQASAIEKGKQRAVQEWAEKAGTFVIRRGTKGKTPYVGD